MASCCSKDSAYPQYPVRENSVQSTQPAESAEVLPIWVDKEFTLAQDRAIYDVVNEWNFALNGQMKLEIQDWNIDTKNDDKITDQIDKTEQGLIIYAMKDDDDRLGGEDISGTLAFVNAIGHKADTMIVLVEHFGNRSLHQVLLHEFGHALGAVHILAPSLMFPIDGPMPFAGNKQANCIDDITMRQVANYHHFSLDKVRYCLWNPE